MSGHSKWSTIKHQKQGNDLRRGLTFTKLANAITIAVKQGNKNPDPDSNFHLRLLMEKARSSNMPKDNIERAIQRGVKAEGSNLEEAQYEGYGPGGIAIIVKATTDNKNRTTSEIKNIFDRWEGKLGAPGSVSFLFKPVFVLKINSKSENIDNDILKLIDLGVEEVEKENERIIVYVSKGNFLDLRSKLEKNGFIIESSEEIDKPISLLETKDKELVEKIYTLIEKLENQDDVQIVYSNLKTDE